jgi:hypothetical protein
MQDVRTIRRSAAICVFFSLCAAMAPLRAGTDVRVAVAEVTDDRYSPGPMRGGLELKLKLSGDGMDGVQGFRILVSAARDDQGNPLVSKESHRSDFESTDSSLSGKVELTNPPRKATSVFVSGTAELFTPKKDPNAVVTVENALATPDKPLKSKGLKASKVEVSVLSKERWAEEQKKQTPSEADLAEMRAEAKKQGASDQEIEAAIELAKGLSEAFGSVPENGLILSGPKAGMERIQSVKILGPDGAEIHVSSTTSHADKKTKTMILEPSGPLPRDVSLRFTLLTDKATFAVPFELKDVPLP